jgi:hypothetical protein
MKKMHIKGLIMGGQMVRTKEALKDKTLNQSQTTFASFNKIDDSVISDFTKVFTNALPIEVESSFEQKLIVTEDDALDVTGADAYVVFTLGGVPDKILAALYAKNRPIILSIPAYKDIFSYGAVFYPYFVRDYREIDNIMGLKNNIHVARDSDDLATILLALKVQHKLSRSRFLCIGEPMYEPYHSWNWGYGILRLIQQKFGVQYSQVSSKKFLELYKKMDKSFTKGEIRSKCLNAHLPDDYDTAQNEKIYYLCRDLIKEHGANAFTINCIASIVHTQLNATACYAISRLNDEKIVSACEADVTTLINMMITSFVSNAPVFMVNPYLFPTDNKLFVSHCTSPTRQTYSSEEKDEFNINPYFERPDLPCALQVLKKEGEVTITGLSHNNLDKMVVVNAEIVRNTSFPTCKTQIELKVRGDIKLLAENYQGRHWGVVYGNHSPKIKRVNDILGIETLVF